MDGPTHATLQPRSGTANEFTATQIEGYADGLLHQDHLGRHLAEAAEPLKAEGTVPRGAIVRRERGGHSASQGNKEEVVGGRRRRRRRWR